MPLLGVRTALSAVPLCHSYCGSWQAHKRCWQCIDKCNGAKQFEKLALAPSALLLVPDKAGKGAILAHQLLIRALLHDLALLNDCRA